MTQVRDPYAVLGIPRDATAEDIKKAYRRLTLECHPDRHPGDLEVAARFQQINAAYQILGDPSERARHDARSMLPDVDWSRGVDATVAKDLIGSVFGDFWGTHKRKRRRGRDLRYTLTVDLEECLRGSAHEIEFEAPGPCDVCDGRGHAEGAAAPMTCNVCDGRGEVRGGALLSGWNACGRCEGTGMVQRDPCTKCSGRGTRRSRRKFEVKLPQGTRPGAERVLAGEGEPGRYGGAPGDLRVTVNARKHSFLKLSGDDILCVWWVSPFEASRGARVAVPTLDGPVDVTLPVGVQSGARLRLRGKGADGERGRGDQFVEVAVETVALDPNLEEVWRAAERRVEEFPSALPQMWAQRQELAKRSAEE